LGKKKGSSIPGGWKRTPQVPLAGSHERKGGRKKNVPYEFTIFSWRQGKRKGKGFFLFLEGREEKVISKSRHDLKWEKRREEKRKKTGASFLWREKGFQREVRREECSIA